MRRVHRLAIITVVVSCLTAAGATQAQAQGAARIARFERDLSRACWFGSSLTRCGRAAVSSWDWFASTILATVLTAEASDRGPRDIQWDGTFPHPRAPVFYQLKGLVSGRAGSVANDCASLPDRLRTDSALLHTLVCEAEHELVGKRPNQWADERRELSDIRQRLARCLPPDTAKPCPAR